MEEKSENIHLANGREKATPERHVDVDDVDKEEDDGGGGGGGEREGRPSTTEVEPKANDCGIPMKKRRTRRGKHKRRYPPYNKNERSNKADKLVKKPEAPYNSNQFLLEDHGNIEELDENLRNVDSISTTTTSQHHCRTRDSSFSVDSDGEFYSSPDDEEQFLIKEFADQYESVQAERLQAMSKDALIREYLMLETKLDLVTKRQKKKFTGDALQEEVDRLKLENEALKRENAALKTKRDSSEDSESDSSDDTSSCSSSCSSAPQSPLVDYSQTNGHAVETV